HRLGLSGRPYRQVAQRSLGDHCDVERIGGCGGGNPTAGSTGNGKILVCAPLNRTAAAILRPRVHQPAGSYRDKLKRNRRYDLEHGSAAVSAAIAGRAVEIACTIEGQRVHRAVPFRETEAMQHYPSVSIKSKHRSPAVSAATKGGAEKIARAIG